jgi:hypothetical protein
VSLRSELGFGLRLAVAGGRTALGRLLLIASGIALGVGLLLSTLGVFPAENAVERRRLARELEVFGPGPVPADRYLASRTSTVFRDRSIAVTYLAPVGDPAPAPWLGRVLGPGEIVASPDLAHLVASPEGALLRPRLPGPIVGTLDPRWLLHPGELVAYVGADADDLGRHAEVVTGFSLEPVRYEAVGVPAYERPLFQVAFLVSVGLLIPILVFVVTGARLSASARESRRFGSSEARRRRLGWSPRARASSPGWSVARWAWRCSCSPVPCSLTSRHQAIAGSPPTSRRHPPSSPP